MIKQVSIFVENEPGSLMNVTKALAEAHINIRAFAAFDTPEFGILRLVVDKPNEAKEKLTSQGFVVRVHDVIGVELVDEKGQLNNMLEKLAAANVNMNYIYSFVIRDNKSPIMVLNTDNCEKATKILTDEGINMIEEDDL
ncbi:MAG: amino acid-binding protein [Suipraeoptans sp.]